MRYPIVIEPGDATHAYGVVVPDLPGCFSAGDTLEEAIENAEEAILLHLEALVEAGRAPPEPAGMETHRRNPDYAGWIWAVVDVDLAKLAGKARRINITIPERVLAMIDEAARREGESRSGFLARAALEYIESRRRAA
jgi:predicted RNase H-like HicB family nuclease